MAQQANVTLNSVVYSPAGTVSGVSKWINRSGGFGTSFSTIAESFKDAAKGGSVVRILFDLELPVVQPTDSDCGCAGTLMRNSSAQLSIWVPVNSTAAERLDFWTRIKDLVASAPFVNAVENLENSYG